MACDGEDTTDLCLWDQFFLLCTGCGHCKKLAPEFESAASSLKDSKIQLASVDCTVEADICKKLEIRGYPTLAVFRNGEEVSKYTGPRDSANIVKFMQKYVVSGTLLVLD